MTKQKTIERKWHEQSEATKQEAEKLPYGKEEESTPTEGPSARDRLPDQPVAIIAGPAAAYVAD